MADKPKLEIKELPDSKPKALVAQENLSEIDWSNEFDDEPVTYGMAAMEEYDWSTAFDEEPGCSEGELGGSAWSLEDEDDSTLLALVATSSTPPNTTEVCSKCSDVYKKVLDNYVSERDKHNKARSEVLGYQLT